MNNNSPSGPTRALADLAFGSQTHVIDTSRPLAWLSPEEMVIDLSDPVQRRFGDYELIETIGHGGMGVVYRARQHGLERDVAIKLLAAGPWASAEFIERFRREARSAARMQHPNIVEIYEFGHRDGLNYFSMRLIDGQSLAEQLLADGAMPPKDAAKLLRTLAEAMDYAHRLGVLHLDLKPANVLLTKSGEPLIADFGLARRIDAGHEGGSEISGTPSYMAPEQAQLESHPLSASTDIYGLGAILYECLTGRPPFLGGTAQSTLERVIADAPEAPRQINKTIPADLEAICLKCLQKDPFQRYASARELADDLGNFLANRPVSARVPDLWERTQRWWEQHKTEVAMFALLLAGFVGTTKEWLRADKALAEAQQHQAVAQEQSTRSGQLAELIAHAYPVSKDEAARSATEDASRRIVSWLDSELGDEPAAQQKLLLALIDELDRADNPGAAQSLLWPIVETLGREFRQSAAEAQIAKGTPRSRMLGAMLLQPWFDGTEADKVRQQAVLARQQRLLLEVVKAAPTDLDVLVAATYYCSEDDSECGKLGAERLLARLQPDNAANWIYALRTEADADVRRDYIHHAATAATVDDHFNRIMQLNREAIISSGVAPPMLMEEVFARIGSSSAADNMAFLQMVAMPIPSWGPLTNDCNPERQELRDPGLREDCLRIGRRLAYQGQALIANMIGSVMIRRLLPGTQEAFDARELRRSYLYTYAARDARTPAQVRASRDDLIGPDMLQYGELEAVKRSLDRAGIPRDPPAGWEPEDPEALMTGAERQVYRARRDELARQMEPQAER